MPKAYAQTESRYFFTRTLASPKQYRGVILTVNATSRFVVAMEVVTDFLTFDSVI